ncbi:hypothetical protein TSUD_357750 [Trifolium subterraneum]|uniref:Uncharacterized protein n=1 Tax=Trifolium subterraneum TaxID=3900 RepID=A0A2Z6NAU5_TRISU|nr:hypothetical protein TSUD_357750 [Trifolium subterraneum]
MAMEATFEKITSSERINTSNVRKRDGKLVSESSGQHQGLQTHYDGKIFTRWGRCPILIGTRNTHYRGKIFIARCVKIMSLRKLVVAQSFVVIHTPHAKKLNHGVIWKDSCVIVCASGCL